MRLIDTIRQSYETLKAAPRHAVMTAVAVPIIVGAGCATGFDHSGDTCRHTPGAVSSRLSPTRDKKCLWLHAVSVGEVPLLVPLLKRIEKEHADWECVVSTTTMTGMALAQKNIQTTQCFTAHWISLGR